MRFIFPLNAIGALILASPFVLAFAAIWRLTDDPDFAGAAVGAVILVPLSVALWVIRRRLSLIQRLYFLGTLGGLDLAIVITLASRLY